LKCASGRYADISEGRAGILEVARPGDDSNGSLKGVVVIEEGGDSGEDGEGV
jgi:hypothetical protein